MNVRIRDVRFEPEKVQIGTNPGLFMSFYDTYWLGEIVLKFDMIGSRRTYLGKYICRMFLSLFSTPLHWYVSREM